MLCLFKIETLLFIKFFLFSKESHKMNENLTFFENIPLLPSYFKHKLFYVIFNQCRGVSVFIPWLGKSHEHLFISPTLIGHTSRSDNKRFQEIFLFMILIKKRSKLFFRVTKCPHFKTMKLLKGHAIKTEFSL